MGPDEHEEQRQIERAVGGDQGAREWCAQHFGGCVAAFAEVAFGTCPHYTRDQLSRGMSPEDLVQEVWYILCKHGWSIEAKQDGRLAPVFVGYLRSTVRNVFWRVLQAAIRKSREQVPTSFQEGIAADTRSVMSKAVVHEQQQRLRALVDGRDAVDRELLHGWMLEVPYAQLAPRVGLTVPAARKRVQRALSELAVLERLGLGVEPASVDDVAEPAREEGAE